MESYEVFDKEFPIPTNNLIKIMSKARNKEYTKEEALRVLLATPELLQPLPFMLFITYTNLDSVISYDEYAELMRKKAVKNKNHPLMNMVNEAVKIIKEIGI